MQCNLSLYTFVIFKSISGFESLLQLFWVRNVIFISWAIEPTYSSQNWALNSIRQNRPRWRQTNTFSSLALSTTILFWMVHWYFHATRRKGRGLCLKKLIVNFWENALLFNANFFVVTLTILKFTCICLVVRALSYDSESRPPLHLSGLSKKFLIL